MIARGNMRRGERRLHRLPRLEGAESLDPDLVRVNTGPLQPLAVLLDAETALGEAVRVLSPKRPLLDEPSVDHDEADGGTEAGETRPGGRVTAADRDDQPVADRAAADPDGDGEPRRHRVRPRE